MDSSVESPVQMDTEPSSYNATKVRRSLRHRSGVHYRIFDITSERESDIEQPIQVPRRWHPGDACRPIIDEAPTFYPSEEEFKDTLAYIAKIRQKAETYGICRIIPPPSWKPECLLKEKDMWDCAKFTTRIQQIDKLQNREPVKRKMKNRVQRRRKRRRRLRFGMTRRRAGSDAFENGCAGSDTDEKFGFQSGSDFSLRTFKKFADHFKEMYFVMEDADSCIGSINEGSQKRWEPTVEDIEGEYWRIVEKSKEEIEVHYGADLETGTFSSGFSKANQQFEGEPDPHALSGWNLNNLPRLSESVLSFESSDISGVVVPWLYVGMCLSSFCWHVEDHHLYSLNYMHFGDPKVWYGVAGRDAERLEDAMKKHLPELFEEQPYLLNELVTQLSPSVLKSEGVPIYRAVQNAGEFVITFPRAYHAGFNCGFNCAEAVNVAPMDWLPHGQCAVELYSEQCRKTSLSHDKLLFGAALEAVKSLSHLLSSIGSSSEIPKWKSFCGKNGMLTMAFKERIAMEKKRRGSLPIEMHSIRVSESSACDEKECHSCFYDLYLSAVGCECSPNRFSCLNHVNMLCSCEWNRRFLLLRYDMDELDTLSKALEGETDAVKKWASKHVCLSNWMQPSISNDSRSSLACDVKACPVASNCRPKVDNSALIGTCNGSTKYDSHEEKEIVLVKGSLECATKGVPGLEKTVYKEIRRIKTDVSLECILPTKLDASETVCVKDVGKGKETSVFDLNLNEAHPTDEEVVHEQLETEKKKCYTPLVWIDSSAIKEEVKNSSSSESALFHFAITKAKGSRCVESPSSNPEQGTNDMTIQRSGKDSACYSRHSVESAASEVSLVGVSNYALWSSSAENSNKVGQSMLFGFDLSVHTQESPCDSLGSGFPLPDPGHISCMVDLYQPVDSMDNFELLELGIVEPGKMWCNKEAIFPNGFRTRTKFTSVIDPSKTCNYISEVLCGVLKPLFKVTVEDSPDVTFTGTSPSMCWGLVEMALEEQLGKYHAEGQSTSSIQTGGPINGMKMFGFLFHPIIQAIEALDPYQCCTEYWEAKEEKRLEQRSAAAAYLTGGSTKEPGGISRTSDEGLLLPDVVYDNHSKRPLDVDLFQKDMDPLVYEDVNRVLGGLIGRATVRELDMLQDVSGTPPLNTKRAAAFCKLLQETKRRRCL